MEENTHGKCFGYLFFEFPIPLFICLFRDHPLHRWDLDKKPVFTLDVRFLAWI